MYQTALGTIFSEPPVDTLYEESFPKQEGDLVFSVEYLPGQFDQRADSAEQCVKLLKEDEEPVIRSATTYVISGYSLSDCCTARYGRCTFEKGFGTYHASERLYGCEVGSSGQESYFCVCHSFNLPLSVAYQSAGPRMDGYEHAVHYRPESWKTADFRIVGHSPVNQKKKIRGYAQF